MSNSRRLRRATATGVIFVLSATLTIPARATAEYALQSGLSWYRFDNPFLFPGNSSNKLNTADSAWSTDIRAGLFLPLPTERSNLQLTGAISQLHYGSLSNYTDQNGNGPYSLNHSPKQLDAIYTWEFSDLLRGRLRHRSDDRLYSYFGGEITPSTTVPPRNISNVEPEFTHTREDSAEVAYRITDRLDLPFTWTQQTLSYSTPGRSEMYNMDSDALAAAIRYTAGTQSTVSAGVRRNRVNFPDRNAADVTTYDSGYIDTELFSDMAWRYTENTIFTAHLGAVSRHFNTISDRDSHLPSVELGMDWHWSPKTTFYVRLWDRPQPNDEADSQLYVVTRGAQVRSVWQATPKSRISLLASLEKDTSQSFSDVRISTPIANDNDRVLRLGIRYDYDITRRLALRVEANSQKTMSQSDGTTYRGSTVQISLNYTFDNITGPFIFGNEQGYNRARQQIEALR